MNVYIHIPFCRSKCVYCDFFSQVKDDALPADYTQAVMAEMQHARQGELAGAVIETIYIGGGTPTALPASFLCALVQEARKFTVQADAEITVECNPFTQDEPLYLDALYAAGVNRLSIGLQAWQNHLLAMLGRTHTNEDFMRTYHAARAAGFTNINVDLMFALPTQTLADWEETLAQVLECRPTHISAYSLTPAEHTPLWDALERGTMALPDDETDRLMYHTAQRILSKAGYQRYEISNFALPGYESRHNTHTWQRRPYYGFGAGAHSFQASENIRWNNPECLTRYLHNPCLRENVIHLSPAEALSEQIILGLRLAAGIPYTPQMQQVYAAAVDQLVQQQLLSHQDNRLALTPKGTDLANQVMCAFM